MTTYNLTADGNGAWTAVPSFNSPISLMAHIFIDSGAFGGGTLKFQVERNGVAYDVVGADGTVLDFTSGGVSAHIPVGGDRIRPVLSGATSPNIGIILDLFSNGKNFV